MPTVMHIGGARVMVRVKDHDPPHVHVIHADAEAKIRIEDMAIIEYEGFSRTALRRIVGELMENKDLLREAWDEIHKKD